MNTESRGEWHPALEDRVALAIVWLNVRAERSEDGYITHKEIRKAAKRYAVDDKPAVLKSLYDFIFASDNNG